MKVEKDRNQVGSAVGRSLIEEIRDLGQNMGSGYDVLVPIQQAGEFRNVTESEKVHALEGLQ